MKKIRIKGFDIEVSPEGLIIYNSKVVKLYHLKSKRHTNGYFVFNVHSKLFYLHKVMAEAFVHNPYPVQYKRVYHIDGNTLNNHPNNLKWGNFNTMHDIQRRTDKNPIGKPGARQDLRSFTEEQSKVIAKRLDNGETALALSKEYGVSDMCIHDIRKRYAEVKSVKKVYTNEMRKTALSLCDKYSLKMVSEITGISIMSLSRWRKQQPTI